MYGIRRHDDHAVTQVPNNPEVVNAGDLGTVLTAMMEQGGLPTLFAGVIICELHITEVPAADPLFEQLRRELA
jgi:hypothetical protein